MGNFFIKLETNLVEPYWEVCQGEPNTDDITIGMFDTRNDAQRVADHINQDVYSMKLTCMQFLTDFVTLDRTWRDGDNTEICISTLEILNSPLFSKRDELTWVDVDGNNVQILDPENLNVKIATTVE